MPARLFELGAEKRDEAEKRRYSSIHTGTVENNCDLIMQGKVLVRIPAIDEEVWARLTAIGAGSNRGFFFVPQRGDEVLVALNQSDPTDAFILGGLWNNQDRTPASVPTDGLTRRTLRTGIAGGIGHELDFDDARQSITITTSTGQTITLDPSKIKLKTLTGMVISLDIVSAPPKIKIDALGGSIELSATTEISLKAPSIKLEGGVISIDSKGDCSIRGTMVRIN